MKIFATIALIIAAAAAGRLTAAAAPTAAAPTAAATAAAPTTHFRAACLIVLRWRYTQAHDGGLWVAETCVPDGRAADAHALDVLEFACIADGGAPFRYRDGGACKR